MSITRELWLAIVVVVLVSIAGSVTIYGMTTKQYLEEQLYAANLDNVSMLALTLSRLDKNPDELDLFITSQFDMGHYASISLVTTDGEIVSQHTQQASNHNSTPRWFVNAFAPSVSPGVAQVSSGWLQYGTVYVETDTTFAIASMWRAATRLIFGLALVGLLSGIVCAWALRLILRPLDRVVEQAESFQNMQFVELREPRTLELKRVVQAMNFLARKSKKIMDEENVRLDLLRHKTQFDDESGLANRDYFISILQGQLAFRDTEGVNCLFLIRFTEGVDFLRQAPDIRRQRIRRLVESIEQCLDRNHNHYSDCRVARLQKNEIALLLTETHDTKRLSFEIHNACRATLREDSDPNIYQSVVKLAADESYSEALLRADIMVSTAHSQELTNPNLEAALDRNVTPEEEGDHRERLIRAIETQDVETFNFPVLDRNRKLVHYQSWAGVNIDGALRKSGYYTHWARYHELLPQLELTTISHLLDYIANNNTSSRFAFLCSVQLLRDDDTLSRLYDQLDANPAQAVQLCFEVRESTATRFPDDFARFCNAVKARGCQVGLKRVGESFSQLFDVQTLGLDYVKIDSAFMADIDDNPANHAFIRGFCSLAHTFGIRVYVDGVKRADTQSLFKELGIDGVVSHIEVIEHLLDE